MSNLITITDIQAFKPLSNNIDATKKLNNFITEAQEFDLRDTIGEQLYLELIFQNDTSFTVANQELMDGKVYVYNGTIYQFDGIKAVLSYYAYSRYLNNSNNNQTAFGTVVKTNPDSEPVSEKTISRLVSQAISGAKVYEKRLLDFLNRNSELYPLFECAKDNKKISGIRITPIR